MKTDMNSNDIFTIFMIGFAVCWYGVYGLRLLLRKERSRLQTILGIFFILIGVTVFKDLCISFPGAYQDMFKDYSFFIDSTGILFLALFFMELSSPGWVNAKRTILTAVPFIAFPVIYMFYDSELIITIYVIFLLVFSLIWIIIAILKAKSYGKAIRNIYSNIENVNIHSTTVILSAFVLFLLVWFISMYKFGFSSNFLYLYYIYNIVCGALVMYNINKMPRSRLPEYTSVNTDSDSNTKVSQQKRFANIAGRLEQLMDDEKLYLDPDLMLSVLVEKLGTNRTYLSEYLSTELGVNFYDYINRLRIEHMAIPMIRDGKDKYTLEYISQQSGFKSVATFRRAFTKVTGVMPSEYKQTI